MAQGNVVYRDDRVGWVNRGDLYTRLRALDVEITFPTWHHDASLQAMN